MIELREGMDNQVICSSAYTTFLYANVYHKKQPFILSKPHPNLLIFPRDQVPELQNQARGGVLPDPVLAAVRVPEEKEALL